MIDADEDGLRNYKQIMKFNGLEDHHSVDLRSTEVTVIPSPGEKDLGSSKVKLKNIVDFTWEPHFYTGQLLAVHMSGKYLAYGIKSGKSPSNGIVRVLYKDSEQRALLRDMRGLIQDLAFAHSANAILAVIDSTGSLFVYTIVSSTTSLVCNVLLRVDADETSPNSHRVIWCPYIPDDDSSENEDVSKLLMVTRGPIAELWCVDNVFAQHGCGPIDLKDSSVRTSGGFTEICEHGATIVEAILSPDGTAIATASLDGEVKFFQVNIYGSALQQACCLHKWKPHDGRPVSSLFFLDDHKNYNPDAQFWRFAITGCDNNTEIKVWSCEKWKCLQTIKFDPSPSSGKLPVLKAGLDLSASFLLLSDICNNGLYILNLAKNSDDGIACVSTISEFSLPYPILSFGIVDAGTRKIRSTGESLEDLSPIDDEGDEQFVIRMYLVQPKSVQECHISFLPVGQNASFIMGHLNHDSIDYTQDLKHEQNGIVEENNDTVSVTIENHNTSLNLMTPDAFSSPAKKENHLSQSPSPDLDNVLSKSPASLADAVQAFNKSNPPLASNNQTEQGHQSGGSSPSREVQKILSLAEPEDDEEDEEEEDDDLKNSVKKDEKNWSNLPMVLLKEVHLETEEPKDNRRIKEEKLIKTGFKSTENAITALKDKMDGISQIIQDQRQELRDLRAEVMRLRQEQREINETPVSMARATQQQLASFEQTIYNRLSRQNEFLTTVESTVKENIQLSLPRVISDVVEPLKSQLRNDVKKTDDIFHENLSKMLTGTVLRDSLTLTIANASKPVIENTFQDTFTTNLLPGFEKACSSMFNQIQDTFAKGTKDYLQQVEVFIDKACQKRYEQQSEALSLLVREELQKEMVKTFGNLQENILKTLKESIKDNMGHHFSDIQARSRATTPGLTVSSPADIQAKVLMLLQRGQFNAAFQQALSASDLNLVVFVCEKTEPSKVFLSSQGQRNKCLLQQPVLLSLVQQLSADLTHRTELKQKWLEEAILNLDPNDPVTREHMGAVLTTLQTQISTFITTNSLHPSAKSMKIISMAALALLHQHP